MLPPPNVRRALALLFLTLLASALAGAQAVAATSVPARYQLRGHLPELGERPTTRVFQTQAAYDAYRASLGDANVFPPASSLFMSFDKDILALYTRGSDTGGRCIATAVSATLDADTLTTNLAWQPGTCGAPLSAHYPFILVAISRSAGDGSAWVQPSRSVCAVVDTADTRACASLGASASATPSAVATSTAAPSLSPTASPSAIPSASRTVTPTATFTGSQIPVSSTAAATAAPTRSQVAAASPTAAAGDTSSGGPDLLFAGALVALGALLAIALMAARRPRQPSGFRRR